MSHTKEPFIARSHKKRPAAAMIIALAVFLGGFLAIAFANQYFGFGKPAILE